MEIELSEAKRTKVRQFWKKFGILHNKHSVKAQQFQFSFHTKPKVCAQKVKTLNSFYTMS